MYKFKVIHIISNYYETKLFRNLIEHFNRLNISSIVYVPRWSNILQKEKNVYMISKKHNKIEKLLYWGQQKYIYKDIVCRNLHEDLDIVHAHRLFYGGYVAYKMKKQYNVPYIVTIRNSDVNDIFKNRFIFGSHVLKVLLEAEKVIFLSSTYKNDFLNKWITSKYKKTIAEKSEVITNGIDELFIEKIYYRRKFDIKNKQICLISVGEVSKNKNQLTTIIASEKLIKKGYNIRLIIIGKIADKQYYNKFKDKSFVEYIPFCSKEDIIKHLRKSDIFIMPSHFETFGLVYAEAMTQGLPVIYTKGQGFDGQFADGYVGYAIKYNDSNALADSILKICDNYIQISSNCVDNINKYKWESISERYQDIYKHIINQD